MRALPSAWVWAYDDLKARADIRAKVAADPDWQKFLGIGPTLLANMESTILLPTNYSPMK